MIVVNLVLGAAIVALVATHLRDKKLLSQRQRLLSQNIAISEYVIDSPSDGTNVKHSWSGPVKDVLYKSKSPLSYDQVVIETRVCTKCGLVNRYITEGLVLAERKNLNIHQGLFKGGIKVLDRGCVTEEDEDPLDF